jgi:hypothetical protein
MITDAIGEEDMKRTIRFTVSHMQSPRRKALAHASSVAKHQTLTCTNDRNFRNYDACAAKNHDNTIARIDMAATDLKGF